MKDLSLKDHYKNQKFNNLHEFFWGFGTAFHTVYAVVPLFLKELGAPNVIATSSAGLFSIIIAIPMLFTAALTRNVTNMKKNGDKRTLYNFSCCIFFRVCFCFF